MTQLQQKSRLECRSSKSQGKTGKHRHIYTTHCHVWHIHNVIVASLSGTPTVSVHLMQSIQNVSLQNWNVEFQQGVNCWCTTVLEIVWNILCTCTGMSGDRQNMEMFVARWPDGYVRHGLVHIVSLYLRLLYTQASFIESSSSQTSLKWILSPSHVLS